MRKGRAISQLLLLVCLCTAAYGDNIVFDNGSINGQPGNPEATANIMADNFTLSAQANITHIVFWDLEQDFEHTPGYNGSLSYWITADKNGYPDFHQTLRADEVMPTRELDYCGANYCVYQNDIAITPLALQGDVEYHLALHNGPPGQFTYNYFFWMATNPDMGQHNAQYCPDTQCFANQWYDTNVPLAFYLEAGSIPEPGTFLLMGTGLAGAIAGLRRRLP
jgi:hypothetical protein